MPHLCLNTFSICSAGVFMVLGWTFHLQFFRKLLSLRENEARWLWAECLGCHGCFVELSCCEATFSGTGKITSHIKRPNCQSQPDEQRGVSLFYITNFPEVIPYFPLNLWAEYNHMYVIQQNLVVWSNVFSFWIMCWWLYSFPKEK